MAIILDSRQSFGILPELLISVASFAIQLMQLGPTFLKNSERISSAPATFPFFTNFKAVWTSSGVNSNVSSDLSSHSSSASLSFLFTSYFTSLVGLVMMIYMAFAVTLPLFLEGWAAPSFLRSFQLLLLEWVKSMLFIIVIHLFFFRCLIVLLAN